MTNRIDQLAKAGLVERKADPNDARRAVVTLTPRGFDLIEKAIADHVQTQKRLLDSMKDSEVKQLDNLLRKLMAATDTDENSRERSVK